VEGRAAANSGGAEGHLCNFRLFWGLFCKFELFNVILNFCNLYCGCKKRKEKEKRRKAKNKKKNKKNKIKLKNACLFISGILL